MALWPSRAEHWLRKAQRGDSAAFRRLYRALYPEVTAFVRRRIEGADGEDLVAGVFHKMLEKLDTYDSARGSVRTWVLGIARNRIIDHFRTRKSVTSVDAVADVLADAAASPLARLEGEQRLLRLRKAIDEYPPEVREMLAMRFGDGMRVREIAAVMGLSEAAVKQRFSRTVRELRKLDGEAPRKAGAAGYAI